MSVHIAHATHRPAAMHRGAASGARPVAVTQPPNTYTHPLLDRGDGCSRACHACATATAAAFSQVHSLSIAWSCVRALNACVCGRACGQAAAAWMREQLLAFPALRPLCLCLKVLLLQRSLGDTSLGGLGSYSLVNLLVHSLQSSLRG